MLWKMAKALPLIRQNARSGPIHIPDQMIGRDQRVYVKKQNGYEGSLTNPMTWERTVEKFHWLTEAFANEELRDEIIRAVEQLDTSGLSNLANLLAQVQPVAVFPTTHPGIQ